MEAEAMEDMEEGVQIGGYRSKDLRLLNNKVMIASTENGIQKADDRFNETALTSSSILDKTPSCRSSLPSSLRPNFPACCVAACCCWTMFPSGVNGVPAGQGTTRIFRVHHIQQRSIRQTDGEVRYGDCTLRTGIRQDRGQGVDRVGGRKKQAGFDS